MNCVQQLQGNPIDGAIAVPHTYNILVWDAVIFGLDKTPFAFLHFRLNFLSIDVNHLSNSIQKSFIPTLMDKEKWCWKMLKGKLCLTSKLFWRELCHCWENPKHPLTPIGNAIHFIHPTRIESVKFVKTTTSCCTLLPLMFMSSK